MTERICEHGDPNCELTGDCIWENYQMEVEDLGKDRGIYGMAPSYHVVLKTERDFLGMHKYIAWRIANEERRFPDEYYAPDPGFDVPHVWDDKTFYADLVVRNRCWCLLPLDDPIHIQKDSRHEHL